MNHINMSTYICRSPSYFRHLGQVGAVLSVLAGIAIMRTWDQRVRTVAAVPLPAPAEVANVEPPALQPPELTLPIDRSAVAEAEARVAAARRDHDRAEEDLAQAEAGLRAETIRAAGTTSEFKALPITLRDPTARLERASRHAASIDAELSKLRERSVSLAALPKPRGKPLVDQAPVARAPEGDEFHFEVRRDRVAFIDLEKLLEKLGSDARIRMRIAGAGMRRVGGTVGPVGAFSLRYELVRQVDLIDEVLDLRGSSYQLGGWEVVPEAVARGETREVAAMPTSEYARAIRRAKPGKSTMTFWVYPDGFELYRDLRDQLHARGYLVAGRPLPTNVPIRGSPGGTTSASQ